MATQVQTRCPQCGTAQLSTTMFEAFREHAKRGRPTCRSCGQPARLDITFAFALGASGAAGEIVDIFLPRQSQTWFDASGRKVEFYPFLVITRSHDGVAGVWLPYWHLVHNGERIQTLYGQWAPAMDLVTFADLVAAAQARGHLTDLLSNQ